MRQSHFSMVFAGCFKVEQVGLCYHYSGIKTMNKRKSVFPFLLLNILVSGLTVFLVLTYWEKNHPNQQIPPNDLPEISATFTSELSPEKGITPKMPVGEVIVSVEGVFGAGDLDLEYILIRNQSEDALNLSGWQLVSFSGTSFTFPNLSLNRNGAVRLYSKAGDNNVIELFLGSEQALWQAGDEISLQDPSGEIYATYVIP